MSINHQCSKSSTIWLAQSHLAAQRMGIERRVMYSRMSFDKPSPSQRLWWSIFVRDSTLRLELGTTQKLQDFAYDVPALTVSCFDLSQFPVAVQQAFPDVTVVNNPKVFRQLTKLAVHRAELACHLSQILAVTHKTSLPLPQPLAHPNTSGAVAVYFEKILRNWRSRLEHSLVHDSGFSRVFDYHRGLLWILYFSTSNALLQRHLSQSPNSKVVDAAVRCKVESDTRKTLAIARTLYLSGAHLPPTLGMGMVYNAVNLWVGLAEWQRAKTTDAAPLSLELAIGCLCALIKPTARGTAVQSALSRLEARVKALEELQLRGSLNLASVSPDPCVEPPFSTPYQVESLTPSSGESFSETESPIMSIDDLFDMVIHADGVSSPQTELAADEDEEPDVITPAQSCFSGDILIPVCASD